MGAERVQSRIRKIAPSSNAPETLADALERLSSLPDSGLRFVGFGFQEQYLAYPRLREEIFRRAAHLSALGVSAGDRLALVVGDGMEFVLSFLAAITAGVVPVPTFPPAGREISSAHRDAIANIVVAGQTRALLTMDGARPLLESVLEGLPGLDRILTVETAFSGEAPAFRPHSPGPEDLCLLQFTSGSTSAPRGVMVTHGSLMANLTAFLGSGGVDRRPDDVAVSWLPLFHDMGLIGFLLAPIFSGNPAVIISTRAFGRDPRIWLRTIHSYRGTITYAPSFAYELAARRVRDADLASLDLSCLRVAGCGAEPIHAETLRNFAQRLAPAGFRAEALLPSYGLAESTLAVSLHPRGRPLLSERLDAASLRDGRAQPSDDEARAVEIVSCGRPLPAHEVAIRGASGEILPERRVGEITVRGPSVTRGYWNDPEATKEAWRNDWLRTGDLGYLADGNLFVCGRLKEVIIMRGANYYPQDIEWALRDVEGVRAGNVAAFGVRNHGSEMLVVVVETSSRDRAPLAASIANQVSASAGIEVGRVVLVPPGTLPKTSSGKLQRRKIKELFEAGELPELLSGRDTPDPRNSTGPRPGPERPSDTDSGCSAARFPRGV